MSNEQDLVDQILGADYFVGNDDSDASGFVGADTPRQMRRVKTPGVLLRLVLPIVSAGTIAQNATSDAFNTPQMDMRVDRFAIAASITANFLVNSISVAQKPLFIANGTLHADLLSSAAFGVSMQGWTIKAGTQIVANVTQLGATAIKFYAGIFGPTEF